jgi:TonB-dependent receptor
VLAILSALLGYQSAAAQDTSSITGRVIGPDGSAVQGAAVLLQDGGRGVLTDASGRFFLPGLEIGRHELLIRQLGFRAATLMVSVPHGEAPLTVRLEADPLVLPGITVVGERGGQLRSIDEQRIAPTVMNVISADEIGVLPEQNVAEALQRVSGLSIQTSRGEGRFVSIRGTAPRLNNVTLNGQTLASPGGSRATQLDMLPADMVTGVQVVKAVTPDMDANSVGGSINITTLSAFDRAPEPFFFGSIEGMRHIQQVAYLDDKQPFEASFTTGRLFGPRNQLGFVIGGNFSRRDFGVSALDPDGWDMSDEGYVFPEEIELQVEDNERTRYGFTGSLDWRPSDRTSLSLRGLLTRTKEITSNSEFEFGFEGDLENATPTGGRYTEGSAELDLSEHDVRSTLTALTVLGEHRLAPSLTWRLSGTLTTGRRDSYEPDATFETVDESRLSSTFDVSQYFFAITPDDPAFLTDPSGYPLRSMSFNRNRDRETTGAGATDLRWDTRFLGRPAFVQAGVKATVRDKTIDDNSDRFTGAGNTTLAQFSIDQRFTVQGGYSNFVHGNTSQYAAFARDHQGDAQVMTADPYATLYETWKDDRDTRESVYASYLMGNTQFGRLGVTAGVRMERTNAEARYFDVLRDTEGETVDVGSPVNAERTYAHWLPAVILRYDATNNLVLRGAWTNTIGRPDYDEFATPGSISYRLSADGSGNYDGTVVLGNLELQPYEASSFDATAEYYFDAGGMLGLTGFVKRIDNPIFEWGIAARDTTYAGLVFDELTFTQDRNADSGTLRGLDLAYAQPLVFLPKPFDGLGVTVNFALIDSDVTIPGRDGEDLPFFEQSSRVINFVPYFQRGPFELRVAMSYRDAYLSEVGEAAFEDRYIDGRTTWDLSAQYQIRGQGMEVYTQVRNLTNEPEVGYQGERSRYDLHVLTGRTVSFGLRVRY